MRRSRPRTSLALSLVTDVLASWEDPFSSREGARRFGLVTRDQMTRTLVSAVEDPSIGARLVDVPQIRHAMFSRDRVRR